MSVPFLRSPLAFLSLTQVPAIILVPCALRESLTWLRFPYAIDQKCRRNKTHWEETVKLATLQSPDILNAKWRVP
jgi:hypothetical protein